MHVTKSSPQEAQDAKAVLDDDDDYVFISSESGAIILGGCTH